MSVTAKLQSNHASSPTSPGHQSPCQVSALTRWAALQAIVGQLLSWISRRAVPIRQLSILRTLRKRALKQLSSLPLAIGELFVLAGLSAIWYRH